MFSTLSVQHLHGHWLHLGGVAGVGFQAQLPARVCMGVRWSHYLLFMLIHELIRSEPVLN